MSYELPPLPYEHDSLAPYVGSDALRLHYDRHHRGYVERLNELTDGRVDSEEGLTQLVRHAHGDLFER